MKRRKHIAAPSPMVIRSDDIIMDILSGNPNLHKRLGGGHEDDMRGVSLTIVVHDSEAWRSACQELAEAYDATMRANGKRGSMAQRGMLESLRLRAVAPNDPLLTPINNLRAIPTAMGLLHEHLTRTQQKPWMRWTPSWSDQSLPVAVTDVSYHETTQHSREHVTITIAASLPTFTDEQDTIVESLTITAADLGNRRPLGDILHRARLMPMGDTADLQSAMKTCATMMSAEIGDAVIGAQVLVHGAAKRAERSYDNRIVLGDDRGPERAVIDAAWGGLPIGSTWPGTDVPCSTMRTNDDDEAVELPFAPILMLYALGSHAAVMVHAGQVEPYIYNDKLEHQLVLKREHRELLAAVLGTTSVRTQQDLTRGSYGGAFVLLHGRPGTGKTLTAMVAAERLRAPLYTIQAAQLGLTVKELEENLNEVLRRAERWNAVLLIDEADVYIHTRGADLQQNAVVGTMLRLLETYRGILFMTTNRSDVIDDAITSRAICSISYATPDMGELMQLWRILGEHYGVVVTAEDSRLLAQAHTSISGRDIKQIIRLVSAMRAANHQGPLTELVGQVLPYRG